MRFFFFAEQLPVVEAGELLGIGADETEGAEEEARCVCGWH